jgi:hypothetical protein
MKKLFIVLIILLFASICYAAPPDWTFGTGQKTASGLIFTGDGYFAGIIVSTDSANAVTLDIYDGITATGNKLIPTTTVTTSAIDRVQAFKPPGGPVHFITGLYIDVTCSGTVKYVVYLK